MKRFIALMLVLATVLGLFAGCNTKNVKIYTRSEWIQELANVFNMESCYDETPKFTDVKSGDSCFQAVQSCAEWEIIPAGGEFKPNDRADVSFAIVTAVKAIGLDNIANSVDGKNLSSDDEILSYFNEKTGVKYIKGSSLYMDTAAQIIEQVNTLYGNLELKQVHDVQYKERVFTVKEEDILLYPDGETANINALDIQVGDIFLIAPCATYPGGYNLKVAKVSGNTVTYEKAQMNEIFDHFTLSGTYDANILGAIPLMDGIDIQSVGGAEPTAQTYYRNGEQGIIYANTAEVTPLAKLDDLVFEVSAEVENISVTGSVCVKDIKVTADIDLASVFGQEIPVVKKATLKLDETLETSLEITGELSKTLDMVAIPCEVYGVGLVFKLSIKVGIEGSVSFVWTVETHQSLEYKPFKTPKINAYGENPELSDIELKVKGYVKPILKAEFEMWGFDIANIGITTGIEAYIKTTASKPDCTDLGVYVPLAIFVGAEKKETLLGKLGVKATFKIWDSSDSPIKKKWHLESGAIVDECTVGKVEEDEKTTNDWFEKVKEEIENIADNIILDYLKEREDGIDIAVYFAVVEEGESEKLGVNALPEGYSSKDLVFTSSDESVATVDDNGRITGVSSGSCIIKVATNDGKYYQVCSIKVLASYDVDFTPLA